MRAELNVIFSRMSNPYFLPGCRARHGIAGPRSRLQAIAGEPFPGFCDLKSVGGRQQFDFRQEQIADGLYLLDLLHMLAGTIDDSERIIYITSTTLRLISRLGSAIRVRESSPVDTLCADLGMFRHHCWPITKNRK